MGGMRIGVIGAGVVGLSTATLSMEAFPTAKITILADKFLNETTSNGAAGIFRPGLQFRGSNLDITRQWLKNAYYHYSSFLENDPQEAARAGIIRISGHVLSQDNPHIIRNELLEEILDTYRVCSVDELKMFPPRYKHGAFFTTLLTDCSKYLPYLTRKFLSRGGVIEKRSVENFKDIAKEFDFVFNCTGLGSHWLCNDKQVTPIRGQVYKVKAPWVKTFLYADLDTYIIPGIELVTLGGCRQFDSWNSAIDHYDSTSIWDRCTKLLPSLQRSEVVKEWAGFRPYRPNVRVESEYFVFDDGTSLQVVHNYGHGGYGVMSAPGTSKYAVELAEALLRGETLKSHM